MSTSSLDSIVDVTSTPTPTTKLSNTFSEIEHKEFTCQIPGCGEKFYTGEQFGLHQQKHKHEMKLRFGGELTFMDDTPTPTRFLKLIEGGEFSDHEQQQLVSPFDHQFRRVTDDSKYDNLSFAIAKDAKDAKYLNEMIPNGLTLPPEPQYGSNISTSSTSTVNGGNSISEIATDAPFPNCNLPVDDKLTLISDYAAEEVTREEIGNIPTNRLIQSSQKASSSDSLQSDSISTTANSAPDMNMSIVTDTPTKKKRGRKPIMDEDPVEKRKRYLERNRAAATRCRNKKKVWVNGLEHRLNELSDANSHLKRENTLLRQELSKFSPSLSNFSLQLRTVNSGLEGDQEGHDRLTGYLSAATINSPSISQANILSHPGLILPMATSNIYPGLDTRSHITSSTQ